MLPLLCACRLKLPPRRLTAPSGSGTPPPHTHTHSHPAPLCRLHLRGTGLQAVPAALWGLTALRELSLGNNAALGRSGEGAFVGLERLTSLHRLGLEDEALCTLPPQLGALSLLEDLDLQGNPGMRRAGRCGFAPLARLASLRRLRLGGCSLGTLPPELALLQLEHGRRVSLPGFQLEDVVLS